VVALSRKNPRTQEEIVGIFGDLGTQDEATARRMMNFIPLGRELKLARPDALGDELGFYGKGTRLRLKMYRDNLVAIEGKARGDLLLAIGESTSARLHYPAPRTEKQPEDAK